MLPHVAFVKAGAQVLDEKWPKGWAHLIDTDPKKFRMSDKGKCVLTQLYGSFTKGLDSIELKLSRAGTFGFDAIQDDHPVEHFNLRKAWIDEIQKRLSHSSPNKP